MMKPKKRRLADREKAFVVRELACYGSPKGISEALMQEYGVQLAPQNIECYDPGKRAGQNLSKKWRELFEHTRQAFLDHVEKCVPEAYKAVRVRHLAHAARSFKARGNYLAMAQMLEAIAKEIGNVHTNRRELTGRDGKPIETDSTIRDVREMSKDEIDQEMARLREQGRQILLQQKALAKH